MGEAGRKFRSAFILVFSSVWLVALIAGWLIPRFGGEEGAAGRTMDRIRWSTGTRQQWDMFHTIPSLRSYQVELLGETASGEKKTFGAIVPELGTLDGRRKIRYLYALSRIFGDQEFFDGYVSQAAKALHGTDPQVERFSIRTLSEPTRALERIRDDGELWTTVPMELGPYSVTHE